MRRRLVAMRDRLGGGVAPVTLGEWGALVADLPRFGAEVDRARENADLNSTFRAAVYTAWQALYVLVRKEVAPLYRADRLPERDLDLRVQRAINVVLSELARLTNDPARAPRRQAGDLR